MRSDTEFLPHDVMKSTVMPQYIVCLSVCL